MGSAQSTSATDASATGVDHDPKLGQVEHPEGAMQSVVDALLIDLAKQLRGKHFHSVNDALQVVEQVVLGAIRVSSLARVMDFHHVQFELMGLMKMRTTSNWLLSADGWPLSSNRARTEETSYRQLVKGSGNENLVRSIGFTSSVYQKS